MSTQSHYETLGVNESSSFEEIRDARDRLLKEFAADQKQAEVIEAAYDAILMNRLRMRQEGKIKVPDRIRFPEKGTELSGAQAKGGAAKQPPQWMSRFIDNPSRKEVLGPAILFVGAAFLSLMSFSAALAVGFLASLFFVNRKENKFLRALLLSLAALVVGTTIGVLLGTATQAQLAALSMTPEQFIAIVTLFFFWLVSSFLR